MEADGVVAEVVFPNTIPPFFPKFSLVHQPPHLSHAYYDSQSQTVDVSAMPLQSLVNMAGASGAIHTDSADLMKFIRALLGTNRLLSAAMRHAMDRVLRAPRPKRHTRDSTGLDGTRSHSMGPREHLVGLFVRSVATTA